MIHNPKAYRTMPVGVVLKRTPGVTRWAAWHWTAVAALPGAGPASWKELRRDGDTVEYHAGTPLLELHGAETEAYLTGLRTRVPSLYVVLRACDGDWPYQIVTITASPYEAQDYSDSGEELVEKLPMPSGMVAWVRDFVDMFHKEEVFVKRRRDRHPVDRVQDGIGDPRVDKAADIFASPALKRGRLQ